MRLVNVLLQLGRQPRLAREGIVKSFNVGQVLVFHSLGRLSAGAEVLFDVIYLMLNLFRKFVQLDLLLNVDLFEVRVALLKFEVDVSAERWFVGPLILLK